MSIVVSVFLIFVMTFSGSMGAFFLKNGMNKIQKITILNLLKTFDLYVGGVLYLIGAFTNIYLLRVMPYTVVYPMTSLTYVWTIIVSSAFLKERIKLNKILAVGFIVIGIFVITL